MPGVKLKKMNNTSPLKFILVSLFLVIASLKIKEKCYPCFLGVIIIGILFFIFGIVKLIKQRNG